MKNKSYKIFSSLFLTFSIGLFILFICALFFTFINQPASQFQLDGEGFSNFLNIYSPSFQIGTVAIVFFTLWVTLERMNQTQKQLELTSENVSFNNYYKHKEEFRSYLKNMPIIKDINKESKIEVDVLLDPIYTYFFNKNYKDFKPELNHKSKKEIHTFIATMKKSTISKANQNLTNVIIDELKELSKLLNQVVDPICSIYTELDVATVRTHFMMRGGHPIDLIEERFKLLSNIYWTASLFEDFLAFDGSYQSSRGYFSINFASKDL